MTKKKILFIANDIQKLLPKIDTTVFLIQQAWVEKYEVWFCTLEDLGINTSNELIFYVNANKLMPGSSHNWFEKTKLTKVNLLSFSAIIVRTDPPFNEQYLLGMNILNYVTEKGVKVVNSPDSLRKFILSECSSAEFKTPFKSSLSIRHDPEPSAHLKGFRFPVLEVPSTCVLTSFEPSESTF